MSDIKSTLFKVTNSLTKSSGVLIKSTKLSVSLASEEENLKALYLEIGKKVHEIYLYGGSLGKVFDDKYKEILIQEEKINQIRQQLEVVKGTKICPKCSKTIDKNAEFCSKCGYRMTDSSESEGEQAPPMLVTGLPETVTEMPIASEPPEPVIEIKTKACSVCGKENDLADKFCLYCGRML